MRSNSTQDMKYFNVIINITTCLPSKKKIIWNNKRQTKINRNKKSTACIWNDSSLDVVHMNALLFDAEIFHTVVSYLFYISYFSFTFLLLLHLLFFLFVVSTIYIVCIFDEADNVSMIQRYTKTKILMHLIRISVRAPNFNHTISIVKWSFSKFVIKFLLDEFYILKVKIRTKRLHFVFLLNISCVVRYDSKSLHIIHFIHNIFVFHLYDLT